MLPLADSEEVTANSWHPLSAGEGEGGGTGAAKGHAAVVGGAKEVARRQLCVVLAAAESAVQDGHALPVLQCLMRLLPDSVLMDSKGAFPRPGRLELREEPLDAALLAEALSKAWGVARLFLLEGRAKGHYTGAFSYQQELNLCELHAEMQATTGRS